MGRLTQTGPRFLIRMSYQIPESTQTSIFILGKVGHESLLWICSRSILKVKNRREKMDKKRTLSSGKKCSRKLKSYNCCCLSKTSWKRNGRQSEKETWDELWNPFSFSFSFPLQGNCFHQAVQNIRAHADSILLEFVTNCCWAVLNFTIMCKNWFWR